MNRKPVLAAVLIVVAITAFVIAQAPPGQALIPLDAPAANQRALDVYSWQSFIALMWPAQLDAEGRPVRSDAFPNGVPDGTKLPGDRGPRTWEGLKADHELFRHGGKAPAPWDQYDNDLPCTAGAVADGSGEKVLTLLSKGTSMQQGVNQAMAGPLIDRFGRYVHYEVRHNKPYYDFIRNNEFYLRSKLEAKHRFPKPILDAPISVSGKSYGSLEIKAAWRVLDPSEDEATANRYYWTWARIPNPKTGECGPPERVALVGFHIIQKVEGFNSWLWSTFEHVDNVPCNYSDMTKCPGVPANYSFNFKDPQLDADAKANRGYAPKNWQNTPPSGDHWRPVNPKDLPPEPVKQNDRINAVRMLPVRSSATQVNADMHALPIIAGTVWQNYILIDTQWPLDGKGTVKPPNVTMKLPTDPAQRRKVLEDEYVAGALNPEPGPNADNVPVANITMETYYQQPNPSLTNLGASCMQCHYAAAQTDFTWTLANRAWPPTRASAVP